MVEEQSEKSSLNTIYKELRNNMLRLEQKLQGFLAEIDVKLEAIDEDELDSNEGRREQLTLLSEEIKKAISGIKELENTAFGDSTANGEFAEANLEDLDALCEAFKQCIKEISNMREQF